MRTFDFPFCHSPLGPIGIAMHFFPIKLSCISVLLINDPSKKGDVEALARFSVSPSPQVRMTLKLTASRQGSP